MSDNFQMCLELTEELEKHKKRINQYKQKLKAKEQECEKAKQNAQDTYDLWQALIESFNILQGEKIKLEQECKRLKHDNGYEVGALEKTIDNLKADNEELKEKLKTKARGWANVNDQILKEVDQLKAENKHLNELLNQALKDYDRTLKTLTEIKEIAEEKAKVNDWLALEILQKINEVENGN